MRIGFLGKGGSGKTTLAASFIRYMEQKHHKPVLAIDADVNVHLQRALGISGNAMHVGHLFDEIANYLRGDRKDIGDMRMIATTPPSLESQFVKVDASDPFLSKYALKQRNIFLLTVGSYRSEDIGATCYHGKLGTFETVAHHLLDTEEDIVVADATAGVDNMGTSLFFAYDLHVFVVEPTLKSIEVFLAFERAAKEFGLATAVVVNKVQDEEDIAFVKRHIPAEKIIATIGLSTHIRRIEQGHPEALDAFIDQERAALEAIEKALFNQSKNWDDYYEKLLSAHQKSSREWWNDFYAQPIDTQRDPEFSYAKVIVRS